MTDLLQPILNSPEWKLGTNLCTVFLIVFWLTVVFWTWRDADRRGAMPWFWAAVVFLFFPLMPLPGWAVYMVARPLEYAADARERELEMRAREVEIARNGLTCPSCLKPIEADFLICPYCMRKLRKTCTSCEKPIKISWSVCPYCKAKQPPVTPTEPASALRKKPPLRPERKQSAPIAPSPAEASPGPEAEASPGPEADAPEKA